ncbi:MAG: dihydroorotate dehydrogenase [Coriobacteriia bacterium]|nr:dihydroorotate dehydrogenase [Coriobacteriia bacterium]MCL2870724.1 dihydroorotate dehydrogenase [Coriobacteriia bacterium]
MKQEVPASTSILNDTSAKIRTATLLGNLHLKNPLTVASGTYGSGLQMADYIDLNNLGMLTTKGVSLTPWAGNTGIRMKEVSSGMLNSIGLQNPGVETFIEKDLIWLRANVPDLPVMVNVCGHSASDYASVIERLEDESGIAGYEVNISCPNVSEGGHVFGATCDGAAEVTQLCREKTSRPMTVKLSPNVSNVAEIARAVEAAGADSVSLINTLLGTAIDIRKRNFIFERQFAGLSGPAIKPVALRMVVEVARAVSVPVIGMGGVRSGLDVAEFMLAGASVVAIGTASFGDPLAVERIRRELEEFCTEEGVQDVTELIGAVT